MYTGERLFKSRIVTFFILLFVVASSSCNLGKKIPYFKDIPADTTGAVLANKPLSYSEPTIKPNDILSITIQTIDPSTPTAFSGNAGGGISSMGANGGTQVSGYLVDNKGEVELPLIGRLKLQGMTTIQARDTIRSIATRYYVDPAVNVRYMNYIITVLGDVSNPGAYTAQSERVSILDAIGMAGDLSITAKRENIMLIREENGQKMFYRVDLTKSDLVSSPYFYLKTGDVIYVEPNKAKAKNATLDSTRDRYISYVLSTISIFISFISLMRLLSN